MAGDQISEDIKQFIFDYIDSAEQLDILLFLKFNPDIDWTADQISKELRSSEASITHRMTLMKAMSLIEVKDKSGKNVYRYRVSPTTDSVIAELAVIYKTKKYKVLELIFSPLKKARSFADAFILSSSNKKNGGSDG